MQLKWDLKTSILVYAIIGIVGALGYRHFFSKKKPRELKVGESVIIMPTKNKTSP